MSEITWHGLSSEGKASGCPTEKFIFPYDWLDDYERLLQVVPVSQEAFYSKLKGNITCDECDKFVQDFGE